MRRLPDTARAACPHLSSSIFNMFIAAMLCLLALEARARGGDCPDGLMSPDDAGTGTLLLTTSIAGRYLPAPRVPSDIDVHISGSLARTKVTQRYANTSNRWGDG